MAPAHRLERAIGMRAAFEMHPASATAGHAGSGEAEPEHRRKPPAPTRANSGEVKRLIRSRNVDSSGFSCNFPHRIQKRPSSSPPQSLPNAYLEMHSRVLNSECPRHSLWPRWIPFVNWRDRRGFAADPFLAYKARIFSQCVTKAIAL